MSVSTCANLYSEGRTQLTPVYLKSVRQRSHETKRVPEAYKRRDAPSCRHWCHLPAFGNPPGETHIYSYGQFDLTFLNHGKQLAANNNTWCVTQQHKHAADTILFRLTAILLQQEQLHTALHKETVTSSYSALLRHSICGLLTALNKPPALNLTTYRQKGRESATNSREHDAIKFKPTRHLDKCPCGGRHSPIING